MRHRGQDRRTALLDSSYLLHRYPNVAWHHVTKRGWVVTVLQSLFRRFQQIPVKVVVELLFSRKRVARDRFQLREAFMEVPDFRLDASGEWSPQ